MSKDQELATTDRTPLMEGQRKSSFPECPSIKYFQELFENRKKYIIHLNKKDATEKEMEHLK